MIPVSRQLAAVSLAAVADPIPEWARQCIAGIGDWSTLATVAAAESMLPLVHRAWVRLGITPSIPSDGDTAQDAYRRTVAQNMRRLDALSRVLPALEQSGPVVVVQGAGLWWSVYGDPGLRPVSDIDLWIPVRDASRYRRSLDILGFVADPTYPDTFRSPDVTLDIHRHLLWADRIDARRYLFNMPVGTLLGRTTAIDWDGGRMRCLSDPDQVLYLTLHLAKHNIGTLGWVADLLLLTHRWGQTEWKALISAANQWGRPVIVHFLGYLIRMFTGEPLPIALDLPDPISRWLIRQRLIHHRIHPWASARVLPARLPVGIQCRYFLEAVWPRQSVLEQIFSDRLPIPPWRLKLLRLAQLAVKAGSPFGIGKR